jgi:exodeoxyribonuclease VII large subunit
MVTHRLDQSAEQSLRARSERLSSATKVLRLLGPQSVLSRGFSYTTRGDGQVVSSVSQVKQGERLVTRLKDGTITTQVSEVQS